MVSKGKVSSHLSFQPSLCPSKLICLLQDWAYASHPWLSLPTFPPQMEWLSFKARVMHLNISCMAFIFCHVVPWHGSDVPYWTVTYERAGCISAHPSVSLSTAVASPYDPKGAQTVLQAGYTTLKCLPLLPEHIIWEISYFDFAFLFGGGSKKTQKTLGLPGEFMSGRENYDINIREIRGLLRKESYKCLCTMYYALIY